MVPYFVESWLIVDGFVDYIANGYVKAYLVEKQFGSKMENIRKVFHLVFSLVDLPDAEVLKMQTVPESCSKFKSLQEEVKSIYVELVSMKDYDHEMVS